VFTCNVPLVVISPLLKILPATLIPSSIWIDVEPSAFKLPVIARLSFINTAAESVDEIEFTIISESRLYDNVSPVITGVKLVPLNLISDAPGVSVNEVEAVSEKVIVCAAMSLYFAILMPPAVDPSCTFKVVNVVSTVTSPDAPIKDVCSDVVPLLNCT